MDNEISSFDKLIFRRVVLGLHSAIIGLILVLIAGFKLIFTDVRAFEPLLIFYIALLLMGIFPLFFGLLRLWNFVYDTKSSLFDSSKKLFGDGWASR